MELKAKQTVFTHLDKWQWKSNVIEAVTAMEEEHKDLQIDVQHVKVLSSKKVGDIGIHEFIADVTIHGKKMKIRDTFSVLWLMEWGVIKHIDSVNLSERFVNTELGKRWLGYLIQECKSNYLHLDNN